MTDLPKKAQRLIHKYFAGTYIPETLYESTDDIPHFIARTITGITIVFDKHGQWLTISNQGTIYFISPEILPKKILTSIRNSEDDNLTKQLYLMTGLKRKGKDIQIEFLNGYNVIMNNNGSIKKVL